MSYIPSLTLPAFIFQSQAISILIPTSVGLLSGLITQPGSLRPKGPSDQPSPDRQTYYKAVQKRYTELKQPPLRPPPWIFAPVWTGLYILMGYASHRAWKTGFASLNPRVIEDTRRAATLYTVQLVLNQIWMPLFFGMGKPAFALVDIVALTGTVGYLAKIWASVDPVASYCLYPYIAWLSFATYLNGAMGYLNGWDLFKPEKKE